MIFKGGGDASGGGSGGNVNLVEVGGATLGSADVVDQGNQALRVNIVAGGGAGGTSSNFGSSFPSAGTAAGVQNPSGKMAAMNVDGSGNLLVNVAVGGGGGGSSTGSTTAYQGNPPWSIVGSGGLFPVTGSVQINGSATVYQGTTVNDNLIAVGGSSISLGQTTMAKSIPVAVASDQGAITVFNGTLDSGNSSTAILGSAGGVFTGVALNVFNQTATNVYIYSDQSSATNGVSLQFSSDGVNWHETDAYTYTLGGNALIITTPTRAEYFRIVYTNGAVAQTVFQLQTIHKFSPAFGNITEVVDPFATGAHVQLTKSLLTAWQGSTIVALNAVALNASQNAVQVAINGSATVYQGTPPWAVVGSGGQVAVVGSGGQITVLQGSSPVAVAGTVTVLQGSSPVSVTGSAGLFPVTGSGGLIGANVSQLGGTALSGANVVDTVNTALRVNIVAGGGSGGTSSNFGSSFPSAGTAVGAQNPTGKMAALNVDGSGNLLVNVQVGGGASSGSTTAYQGSAPWSVVGSGGLFPISGSATVYQGSSQWVVTGSGGLFPVTGSGGVVGIVGSTSSGALSVVGSGGVFPITGSGGIIGIIGSTASGALSVVGSGGTIAATQGTTPWAVTGSGGVFGIVGSTSSGALSVVGSGGTIAVTQGTSPWAVAGSGGVFGILGSTSSGALSVVGSGGTFPITGSGGAIGIIGSTASGALSVIGSGGLINVTQVPIVSGSGHFCNSLISLNTTNGSCVKSSPSSLYGWAIVNTNASIRYVKLYSKGTTISVGTDTPIVTLPIPGNANGAGMLAAEYNAGITFGSGLGYAVTVNAPAADSTAVGSGDIVMNLFYN
jgi:hypothetical protein